MDAKTLFQNLQTELKEIVWTGTSNKIFGEAVHIVNDLPLENLAKVRHPSAFIIDNGGSTYTFHDNLWIQNFSVSVFVANMADLFGEGSIVSANRTANTSRGAGILDIEKEFLTAMSGFISLNSAAIILKGKTKTKNATIKGNSPFLYKTYNFTCRVDLGQSSPSTGEILRNPGWLYWNPVDISGGNYGTNLGYVERGVLFDPQLKYALLPVEETGEEPIMKVYLGAAPIVIAELLNYDVATVNVLFPGLASSSAVLIPNQFKAGTLMHTATYSKGLLYVPLDTNTNPCLYLKLASPNIYKSFSFQRGNDTVYSIIFNLFRADSSNYAIVYIGPLSGL